MLGCSTGTHYKTAILSMRKAGAASSQDFMVITLEDAIITSYNVGGSAGGDVPMENLTLNFARVKVEYWRQKSDGSYEKAPVYWWDVKNNVAL
jgi:type VI secretion system secreted protein Hcp